MKDHILAMTDAADDMQQALDYAYRIKPGMSDDEIYDTLPTSQLAGAYFRLRDATAKARGAQ